MAQLVRIESIPPEARGGVISIGNFDGVHVGHAALIRSVLALAKDLEGPSAVLILDPHPVSLLRPEAAPQRLMTISRRAERLGELGIDFVVTCSIDRDFLNMTADQFFNSLVVGQLQARGMVEGPNFFFGRNRGGDIGYLRELCVSSGVHLEVAEAVDVGAEMASSTRIRRLLANGDLEQAVRLLDAPYQIEGTVIEGAKRGRHLGFPTANLGNVKTMLPGLGVYGATVAIEGQTYLAAVHVGPNPTFETANENKVEVHLLDYTGDLYGTSLLVDFHIRVRDIARFESPEQLASQLKRDIEQVRQRLSHCR